MPMIGGALPQDVTSIHPPKCEATAVLVDNLELPCASPASNDRLEMQVGGCAYASRARRMGVPLLAPLALWLCVSLPIRAR
jgi:hypothetical protein